MPPILYGIGEFYYEFLRDARKSCTKKLWHIDRRMPCFAYTPKKLEVRICKLKNLLSQKLTFRLLLVFS